VTGRFKKQYDRETNVVPHVCLPVRDSCEVPNTHTSPFSPYFPFSHPQFPPFLLLQSNVALPQFRRGMAHRGFPGLPIMLHPEISP
jgi:hypothetical protein